MQTQSVILTKVKETKNTVRYDSPVDEVICPAIYLRKANLTTPYPQGIKVTIEEVK